MNLFDWIPAVSTSGLLALVIWLSRALILTRLKASVQHEFDSKLEALRADLRKSEELLKADLRSKETQLEAMRSGALSALTSRQNTLFNRRLEAVDQLWTAVISLRQFKGAMTIMSRFNFEKTSKEAAKNPRLREMFEQIAERFDFNKIEIENALKARPFVSPIAWAIFMAYYVALSFSVTQIHIIKIGIEVEKPLDPTNIDTMIKMALPHQASYIAKYGPSCYYHLVDELESHLLDELRKILDNSETDKASVEQAAKIIALANCVLEEARNAENLAEQRNNLTI